MRLGDIAHRVRASFLPGPNSTVESKIKELRMARIDLTSAAVLEKNCVYIVPLLEELHLPDSISGKANPKSTTGRLDIFTRLITDYGVEFDRLPAGYGEKIPGREGNYTPRSFLSTFTVGIRAGMKLSQLRFVEGNANSQNSEIRKLDRKQAVVYMGDDPAKARFDKRPEDYGQLGKRRRRSHRVQGKAERSADRVR